MPLEFLAIVLMVVLVPGVDQLMVLRNTLARGRIAGIATALGIGTASSVQALLVSFGIGAVIVASQPVFEALRWAGVLYLLWLGFTGLRSAWRGFYDETSDATGRGPLHGFRDGVLCNITNPKMLVFYLALLPQFVGPSASIGQWILFAMTVPIVGTAFLIGIPEGTKRVRRGATITALNQHLQVHWMMLIRRLQDEIDVHAFMLNALNPVKQRGPIAEA